MKKVLLLAVLIALFIDSNAQRRATRRIALIPQPVSIVENNKAGNFILPSTINIIVPNNEEVKKIASLFAAQITPPTGYKTTIKAGNSPLPKSILFLLTTDKTIADEGYKLKVTSAGITLTARKPAGIFYGVQTLLQLLPSGITSTTELDYDEWDIPAVTIEDQPRFGWRGLMLDVSRHFFTVAQVKDYIDQMVKYKFNLLHLGLTNDQGWRIQIKSLPKLTEVGAWRVERTGTFGNLSKPQPGEPATYGGFYTHEDIKELVKYAADRFVNILPEIDVPGHSLAAIASYPELSCTPGEYYVSPGDRFMVWPGGGQHFYGLLDNTICPANEKAYEFLDKVFTEVAQLFPFGYIHMGGDETARNFWEKSEQIKALMKKENLKDLDEVQSYFVKRVEKIINSKGKKMIGWDEILDGGLAPNAAVMSWRGMKGGIEAAKQGHEVVMSPTDFAYIDYMQGDAAIEPPVYSTLRLKKAYQFEPLPEGVDAKLIKGGQANLWTEQVYNTRHMQYMTWPRAFAIAEVLWSSKEKRNWEYFSKRVENHFKRLDMAGVKYAPSIYDPIITATKKDTASVVVKLETEIEGLDIHYSFDNSFPDNFYPVYKEPLTVPRDAATMKLITYRNNEPIGRMMVLTIAELRKRAGIK
ncbi:MAG: family 20 glycosylhydrolase [Chitinophagaceae bacterium]|nr:family 20 glycosylhydrolase [Chitinophagaceae bacterium]MBK7680120.1 family 20 glycosylhydrolase [Chitinophagaceae bacterium]MBK9660752.1 family 20 glycosylhydrolase [Chitinophagaceae bacterium]MBK9937827.1 family 20 glycosylhydrolase [Chitinophagaceae bacterium]HQW42734.1 family 20 glycosylhydrolase [Chitinophagaceae bacterium]